MYYNNLSPICKGALFKFIVEFLKKRKKSIDRPGGAWYYISCADRRGINARVVELADSLDSGSSVQYARAGSSPASRTMSRFIVFDESALFVFCFPADTLYSSLLHEVKCYKNT